MQPSPMLDTMRPPLPRGRESRRVVIRRSYTTVGGRREGRERSELSERVRIRDPISARPSIHFEKPVVPFLLFTRTTADATLMSETEPTRAAAGWRRFPRHPATRLPSLRASILAGPDIQVINVARGGLLVESDVRLTPGVGVCLNVTLGDQVYQIAGRVSRVDASLTDGRVKYRAGIALDQEMAIFDLPPLPDASPADAEADRALDDELQERLQPPLESDTASALRAEVHEMKLELEQQREAGAALRQAVDSGETARRQLIDVQAAERSRWAEDRKLLQERARENEEQAATLARKIRSVVEAQRDQAEQHALEKSKLEAEAGEARQQLTELRAVHASLLATISQRLEAFERDRAEWQAERERATSEIEAAERWSSDQQDLLYRIRQQMAGVFSLLDGSPHLLGPRPVARELPPASAAPRELPPGSPAESSETMPSESTALAS